MQLRRTSASKASEQLLDHERLGALINNMTDAVLAIDSTGVITLSNSVALDILDTNSLTAKKLNDVFHLIDKAGRPVDALAAVLAKPAAFTTSEWRLQYPDSSTINLYFSSSPVRSGFGSTNAGGFVLLFRDITREKSVEEERAEFISVASHELRTPIAIAEGNISNAQMLAEHVATPDTIKQTLATAHDQVIFLGNLINDLSMLSRADRDKLALTIEQIDVAGLVNSLVHDYEPQAVKKGLSLKAELVPDLGSLSNSQLYVREILQNFITNSLKYTEKGGITISAAKNTNGVEFAVIDTGIGISQGEQAKLFDKFFRSDDWRVKKVNGTGLGLYIASKLARLISANISMTSTLNKGSTFKIQIPSLPPTPPKP